MALYMLCVWRNHMLTSAWRASFEVDPVASRVTREGAMLYRCRVLLRYHSMRPAAAAPYNRRCTGLFGPGDARTISSW